MFSFATLSGLTEGELVVDVGITLALSFSGFATLLLGASGSRNRAGSEVGSAS